MEKAELKVFLVSGEAAKAAYREGERDVRKLRRLGFFEEFEFQTREELEAFARGFETCKYLENPELWLSPTRQIKIE